MLRGEGEGEHKAKTERVFQSAERGLKGSTGPGKTKAALQYALGVKSQQQSLIWHTRTRKEKRMQAGGGLSLAFSDHQNGR